MMKLSQDVNTAVQLLRGGRLAEAATAFRVILDRDPDQPDALHSLGLICGQTGQFEDSAKLLARAIDRMPERPVFRFNLAKVYEKLGRSDDAIRQLRVAIALDPLFAAGQWRLAQLAHAVGDLPAASRATRNSFLLNAANGDARLLHGQILRQQGHLDEAADAFRDVVTFNRALHNEAYVELSTLLMPGREYYSVLRDLHETIAPRTYLEIGVSIRSLGLARNASVAVGVDPVQGPEVDTLFSWARFFKLTSDRFFQTVNVPELFGGTIDFAFIDGLHTFDQTLRDFVNVERYCSKNSIIALHDTVPVDELSARRDRVTGFWAGDVWKIINILVKYRPDLEIVTVRAHPTGVTVVRNLDPTSTVLRDRLPEIIAEFMAVGFDACNPGMVPLVGPEESDVAPLLASVRAVVNRH